MMEIEIKDRWHAVKRRVGAVALAGALSFGMFGCSAAQTGASSGAEANSQAESSQQGESGSKAYAPEIDESVYDLEYSKRDSDPSYDAAKAVQVALKGASAEAAGTDVTVDGSTVTIGAEGVYVLSGSLDDGQIVVNAPEDAKVQLVLSGASIANADAPAIYVEQADKCFVTLADGTDNSLSDGADYADEDAEANAALYATCDLTLQGSGELSVAGNHNDAIKTKDDLVITGGQYAIKAAGDALVGNDSVKVSAGTFAIDAGNDGIKSGKDDDESKGFVSIDGGTFKLNAADKGINAERYVRVSDGATLDITAEDDAIHSNNYARIAGGNLAISSGDDAVHAEYVLAVDDGVVNIAKCVEGYEAQVITVNGSTTHIVSSDDGINASTGGVSSSQGQMEGRQGGGRPDGAQPDGAQPDGAQPDGAQPDGAQPGSGRPDGVPDESGSSDSSGDGKQFVPRGGKDGKGGQGNQDGQGAQDGSLPDGQERPQDGDRGQGQGDGANRPDGAGNGMGGGPMGDSDENCVLTINGGEITIEADGDGIDSNGYLYVNGGTVYVSGPTNGGNGSLDYGLKAEIAGGTVIAAGSSGMAESFTGGSQGFALVNASGSAGDTIAVKDASGNTIASYTPTKSFQCVVVSVDGMTDSSSYVLSVNGTDTSFTASTTGTSNGMGNMGDRPSDGEGGRGFGESQSTSSTIA